MAKEKTINLTALFIDGKANRGYDGVTLKIRCRTPGGKFVYLILDFSVTQFLCAHRTVSELWHQRRAGRMHTIQTLDKVLGTGL